MGHLDGTAKGKLRIGVIGMGFGAGVHLPALSTLANVVVSGVADAGSGRARIAAAKYAPRARVFDNGHALAEWPGIDAVSIAVPPRQQAAIVRTAIDAGKHILCEKPFGAGLDEITGLAADAMGKGLVTAIGYEFRYDTAIAALCKAVREGLIGPVRRIAVTWLTGGGLDPNRPWSWRHDAGACGGVLLDWCSHVIDYAFLIAGADVTEISARTSITVLKRPDGRGGVADVTAPDSCEIACLFANGVAGRYTVSNVQAAGIGHKIEVYGDSGRIVFHHAPPFTSRSKTLTLYDSNDEGLVVPIAETGAADGEDGNGDDRVAAFRELARDFSAVAQGSATAGRFPDFAAGERVWRVLEAARNSAAQGSAMRVQAA